MCYQKFISWKEDLKSGWGGRIRTYECRLQKPVPYHFATPQKNDDTMLIVLIFLGLYNLSLSNSTVILTRFILDRELKVVAESCRMGFGIQTRV